MQILEKTPDLLDRIRNFEPFQSIDDQVLKWLIDHSKYLLYEEGEHLFFPGKKSAEMQIIVQGEFVVKRAREKESKILGTWGTGYVTGVLPFSRMKEAAAFGTAIEPTYTLELHKDYFLEMVNVSYELVQNLVGVMSNRIRDFTHLRLQDEKLMSLGKLSAGLAHELNNPASAMIRGAEELYRQIHSTPEKFKGVMTMRITPEQTDEVNDILFAKIGNWEPDRYSMMEREERMDDIVDWLEDKDIDDGEDLAETFVEFNLNPDELEKIEDIIGNDAHLPLILKWLESTMNLERLVTEIRESADRISKLIKSIKSYSHMDRSVDLEQIDIHEGIINTKIMLNHKLKLKSIQVNKQLGENLPKIQAFPGELNQLWTNLFDNAIDAMDEGGTLSIKTYQERETICVEINDTGHGIPAEKINRIFDPFFTTKDVGKGTGLGLDIVRRIVNHHKGDIKVTSEPGNTTFLLCFPIL